MAEGITAGESQSAGQLVIDLGDEIVVFVGVANGKGKRLGVAGREERDDFVQRRVNGRDRGNRIIEREVAGVDDVLL